MSDELVGRISPEELEMPLPPGVVKLKEFVGVLISTDRGLVPGSLDQVTVAPGGEVISVVSGIHHHVTGMFCRGILVTGVMWVEGEENKISWVLPERKGGYSYVVDAKHPEGDIPDMCITLFA